VVAENSEDRHVDSVDNGGDVIEDHLVLVALAFHEIAGNDDHLTGVREVPDAVEDDEAEFGDEREVKIAEMKDGKALEARRPSGKGPCVLADLDVEGVAAASLVDAGEPFQPKVEKAEEHVVGKESAGFGVLEGSLAALGFECAPQRHEFLRQTWLGEGFWRDLHHFQTG